jgi:uncharacterized Zn finger protein (UPF0148 family)
MQDPWMEMDCPECGMDYDVPIGTVFCPGCGSEWSAVEIASANKYNADGTLMRASQPNA